MEPRGSGMCPETDKRADQGWVRAGLAVLVAGLLGGGVLAAAGGDDKPRTVTADGVATASLAAAAETPKLPDSAEDDPQVGERVQMGADGGSVTVLAVEDRVSAGRLFGAGDNAKYVAAEVKGCSGPNEKNITFQPSYFLLRLDDGTIRDSGIGAKKPELTGGTIPAGKCLSGWVTFVAPEGALPTAVIYDGSTRTTWTVPVPKDAKPTTTTTMKPGAATPTTEDPDGSGDSPDSRESDSDTTSTTRAKASTSTTAGKAKPTSTTASTAKPTATTARSGATATTKPSGSTATTKPSGSTATTQKPASEPTSTTSAKKTTATTTPAKAATTTTTGANVEADPADSDG